MKDESREEASKGIEMFSTEELIKSIIENRMSKLRDIEMFLKELEKGRSIVNKDILTV